MRKLIPLFVLAASCTPAPEPHAPEDVGVVRVPIHLEGGMPWVDATIGGRPVRLLLDLGGFDAVALIPDELKKIEVTWTGESRITFSLGESAKAREYVLPEVELGGVVFSDVTGHEDLLHDKNRKIDRPGYLGLGLLRRFRVVIDYPARQLVLIWPDAPMPEPYDVENWPAVEFEAGKDGVVARAKVNGIDRLLVWDTGASHCVLKSGLEGAAPVRPIEGYPFAKVESFRLAGEEFGPLDFALLDFKMPKADGFVGYSLFAKHAVYIDFASRKLSVKP
jgi:predicted aspartyl protease